MEMSGRVRYLTALPSAKKPRYRLNNHLSGSQSLSGCLGKRRFYCLCLE